ncbi:MAG: cytochrome c3 family protein [Desulfobacteraceae bacterium]|nr:NapC/NirT family cytochrome c [Desulfobacteraceae bacterium]
MKKKKVVTISFLLFGLAVFIGFLLTAFTYKVMTVTSTPGFCASCHEIEAAVESWRTSTHASNDKGFKATCMDCHLPPPENTIEFFFLKTKHGLKDVFAHLFFGEYNKEEMQEKVHREMQNKTCMNCHSNILYIQTDRGAMKAHREAVYSTPQRSCMECHAPLVHIKKETYSAGTQLN